MIPNWQTLFASRPLVARATGLPPSGLASPLWFASASSADLMELPADLFLTTAESTRAGAFKFGQPRENFTLGRLAGKLALAAAVRANRPPTPAPSLAGGDGGDFKQQLRSFEIINGEQGQPVVLVPAESGFKVSLSHVNGSGVAVAFPSGFALGLDLELIDARRAETVRKAVPLSAEEEVWLKTTSLPEATALLLLWTARESLGKALGCGLACRWETLAMRKIEPAGDGVYSGRFLHQPQFRCWSWIGPEAVMSLAFAPT